MLGAPLTRRNMGITPFPTGRQSGRSSGVEHNLAKVGVESSNLFARSSFSGFLFLCMPRSTRHRFPAAFDDAYATTCWVAANAAELGIDPTRLAVGGDSAGGNLAAAVAQRGRDDSALAIAFQLLIYPVTDLSLGFPSMQEFADGYRLTRAAMACFIEHYLGPQGNRNDPRAAPLLAPDLTGLPPALVLTAGCDPLRDEGKAYADKLAQAGVTVEYRCFDGMIHGFVGMPGALKQATVAQREAAAALRRALGG